MLTPVIRRPCLRKPTQKKCNDLPNLEDGRNKPKRLEKKENKKKRKYRRLMEEEQTESEMDEDIEVFTQ